MSRPIGELIISLTFLALAAAFLVLSFDISNPNAMLFPRMLGVGVLVFSAWSCLSALRGRSHRIEAPAEEGVDLAHFLAVLGLSLLYVPAMALAGYVAATAIFIAVGIYLLGYRNLKVALSVAVLVTLFVFVVFKTFMYASLPSSALDLWLTELMYRYFIS